MPRMRVGETLHSDTGTPYLVVGPLGEGGFGEAYVGQQLSARGTPQRTVAIKVCQSLEDWHGEAYFGRLLQGDPRVVELLDAFVTATGRGQRQRRRHVLVFEHMDEGTVWDAVERDGLRWSEGKVRAEIRALLKLLRRMHGVWIIHRDIKPDNVYLRDGRLVLGDFGITKLALDQKGSDASKFQPDFAPRDLASSTLWGPAEDIFQVGLLAATLLSGEIWWNDLVSARAIAGLDADDAFKSWIWHATGARSKRYWHADDALDALSSLRRVDVAPGRAPRTLRDQPVVFSGRLDGLTRAQAMARARAVGAHPQTRLTDATTVVVVGRVGTSEGLKMFGVRERLRTGQPIRVINQEQFVRLTRRVRLRG
ncbi:protein kinase [Nocardioides panacis]|uniref:Protein kinase n=1 Tax=Nocardioides panacis TaxID=2849501 RepID=A0A975Y0A5_9ACTN|nr:protein kinase [Nocardioides panacis]QWZ08272.1 protein kinase [Nocardioides panacis]